MSIEPNSLFMDIFLLKLNFTLFDQRIQIFTGARVQGFSLNAIKKSRKERRVVLAKSIFVGSCLPLCTEAINCTIENLRGKRIEP